MNRLLITLVLCYIQPPIALGVLGTFHQMMRVLHVEMQLLNVLIFLEIVLCMPTKRLKGLVRRKMHKKSFNVHPNHL